MPLSRMPHMSGIICFIYNPKEYVSALGHKIVDFFKLTSELEKGINDYGGSRANSLSLQQPDCDLDVPYSLLSGLPPGYRSGSAVELDMFRHYR